VRSIVIRLANLGHREGQWIVIEHDHVNALISTGPNPEDYKTIDLVPTGTVEWDGNRAAEVWVPEDKLDYWRAEFDQVTFQGS
jgi:hypothetical protein